MNQPNNPKPSQPAQIPDPATNQSPTTESGKMVDQVLRNIWEPLDLIGKGLLGDLWRTTYLTIQDAVALSILLRVPGAIGHFIIGKDFSTFKDCVKEDILGVSFWACFIIVISDFCLWIVLSGRILGRFWADLQELRKSKKVSN